MAEAAAFWDRVAEKYAASPVRDEAAYAQTLERVRAHLGPEDSVLELGCGTGTTALKLAGGVKSYLATDVSAQMLRIAEARRVEAGAQNLSFTVATAQDQAIADRRYDAVLAFNLLHLLPDAPGAIRRVHELLAPGGLFISKTPCLRKRAWLFGPLIWVMRLFGKAPKVVFLGVEELDDMMRAAGFEIEETGLYPPSTGSRFIVARKR